MVPGVSRVHPIHYGFFLLMCHLFVVSFQMIHSKNFSKDKKYRAKSFQTCAEDRPLFAQFCGDDAAALINAAKYIEGEVDAVDINLGCPQGIARRGHYGSFLLEEPDLICHLVRSLYDNLKCPVTCKIRLLPDYKTNPQKTIDLAVRLQNSGCSILTVHGRTREMIKNAIGPCDFEMIKRIKAALRIPVFSNGGIETFENISECLAATKADGVMVSEAILGIPQLFDPVKTATDSVGPLEIAKELIAFFKRYPGVDGCLKPHLFKILFKELAFHTDIRSTLGGGTVEDVVRIPDLLAEAQKKLIEEGKVLSEEYKAFPIWYSRHQTHKHVVEKAAAQALQNEQKLDEKESRCVECVDVSANGQDGFGYEVAAEKVGDKRPLDSQRNEGGNSKKGKTE